MVKKELFVFLNPTLLCNINCKYCFFSEDNRKHNNTLLDIDKTINFLNSKEFEHSKITVAWEGGEITTIPPTTLEDWFGRVFRECPNVSQTAVTNLFSTSEEFMELSKKYFKDGFETSFAFGDKDTWDGNGDKYKDRFRKNLIRVLSNNIKCPVNIELNNKSTSIPPNEFLGFFKDIALETGKTVFLSFDYAMDFRDYQTHKKINGYGYPEILPEAKYSDVGHFLKELYIEYLKLNTNGREFVKIVLFEEVCSNIENKAFNICMDEQFFTINPDGSVTTNPLFSELEETFIGNIYTDSTEDILNNPKRNSRKKYEIQRQGECLNCEEFSACLGSSSYAPIMLDNDTECCGFKSLRKFIKETPSNRANK